METLIPIDCNPVITSIMQNTLDLTNHFLIAMPGLLDPNFYRSVTYICQHDEHGAIGLILTRETDLDLEELLQQLNIEFQSGFVRNSPVILGGPVNPQNGFILHRPKGDWDTTLAITDEIGLTTSLDVLNAIAQGHGPDNRIIALGYAGWDAGQLENEVVNNAWLTLPASADLIFNTPPQQLWQAAANTLGIDISRLSGDAGHA